MKENKLAELSLDFSVDIINLVKHLKAVHETIVSNQIGRSGTSIGANNAGSMITYLRQLFGRVSYALQVDPENKKLQEYHLYLSLRLYPYSTYPPLGPK